MEKLLDIQNDFNLITFKKEKDKNKLYQRIS